MVRSWCEGCGYVCHVTTGIWDVMTNEEVVEFVRSAIAEGITPDIVSTCVVVLEKIT